MLSQHYISSSLHFQFTKKSTLQTYFQFEIYFNTLLNSEHFQSHEKSLIENDKIVTNTSWGISILISTAAPAGKVVGN